MKKTFTVILVGIIALTPLFGCTNPEESTEETQKQQIEQSKEIKVTVDRTIQSADDFDNSTTRAIEPEIVAGLNTINPNYVQEIIVNTNMVNKTITTTTDTSVNLDVLFLTDTLNKDKESVFVDIAKQLRKVKSLKKFTIWTYEGKMYNPDDVGKYMIVVYTKYLPTTSDFTFEHLVDSSNNGSINGVQYFNENRK